MATTVVVIDDSASIRSIIKVFLMGKALEIVEAEGAERGLRLARLLPVSLVIADINMPDLDGLAMLRLLREDGDLRVRNTPVLLLSGDPSPDVEQRALAAGANAFLRKPVDAATLGELVERLVGAAG